VVAQVDVCATLEPALAAYTMRCNPELNQADANKLAKQICSKSSVGDTSLPYDAVAAGQCKCDLENETSCSLADAFRQIASCAAINVGTLQNGDVCSVDQSCQSGFCYHIADYCGGTCTAESMLGEACGTGFRCELGTSCQSGTCQAQKSEDSVCLMASECAGSDAFPLAVSTCTSEATGHCKRYRRAGETCSGAGQPCHKDIDTCVSGVCVAKPGLGEACAVSVNVANPTHSQWNSVITMSKTACRIAQSANPFCGQTGPTSGDGTCTLLPKPGEDCGLGQGRVPLCEGGWCQGLNPTALAAGGGVCMPKFGLGQTCDPAWTSLGGQCQSGLTCPSSTRVCTRPAGSPQCQ
jgi:hypothetical protein